MMDDLENKGKDMMENPEMRSKIEQMAQEKGISMEEAKQRLMQHGDNQDKNQ